MTQEELAYGLSCGATLHISDGLKMVSLADRPTIKGLAEFMHCFENVQRDVALIKQIGHVNDGPSGGVMMYENDTPHAWSLWLILDIRAEEGKLTGMRAVIVLAEKSLEQTGRKMAIQTIDFLRDQIRQKQGLEVVEDFWERCE